MQQGAVCCMHTLPIVSRGGAPSPRCGDVRRRSHEAPAVARPIFGCCPEAGVRLSPRHATATDAYQAAQGLGNAGAWASGPRPRDWAAHAAPARRDPPRGATRTWAPESSRCPRFLSGASVRRATRAFRRTRAIVPIHVHAPCRYHPPRVISRTQRHAGGASKTGASEQSKSVARHSSSRAECPAVRSTQQSPARRKEARAPRPRSTYVQPSWRAGRSWLERALQSARSVDVSKGEEL